MLRTLFIGLILALPASAVGAADTPLAFEDPAQQGRYAALLEELRCLVCQNQSLADSHADLAQDLRNEVYRMVSAGQDKAAILDFMVKRYGDFVLYRPPVKSITWSLWFGPFILLLLVAVLWRRVQRRPTRLDTRPLSDEERARLASLVAPRPPGSPLS